MNQGRTANMVERWYDVAFADHYPLLYAHRDEAEAHRCLALLLTLAPLNPYASTLPVLDLGCGDGRHLQDLASSAPVVVGLDLSAPLLKLAQRRRDSATGGIALVRGDMGRIPLRDETCGGVFSLFTSFGYFGDLAANAVVLAEVARVLAPGGHWFLDYLDCDRVRQELGTGPGEHRRVRTLGPCRFTEVRRLSPGGDRVIKDVTVEPQPGCGEEAARYGILESGLRYCEQVALFTVEEIDRLAGELGLRRVAAAGSYQGEALGRGDRWLLVFRRE